VLGRRWWAHGRDGIGEDLGNSYHCVLGFESGLAGDYVAVGGKSADLDVEGNALGDGAFRTTVVREVVLVVWVGDLRGHLVDYPGLVVWPWWKTAWWCHLLAFCLCRCWCLLRRCRCCCWQRTCWSWMEIQLSGWEKGVF